MAENKKSNQARASRSPARVVRRIARALADLFGSRDPALLPSPAFVPVALAVSRSAPYRCIRRRKETSR